MLNRFNIIALLISLTVTGCNYLTSVNTIGTGASTVPSSLLTTNPTASVQLTWTASLNSPKGYIILQSSDGVKWAAVETLVGAFTSAKITGLTVGQTYYFQVQSYNAAGYSPASSTVAILATVATP